MYSGKGAWERGLGKGLGEGAWGRGLEVALFLFFWSVRVRRTQACPVSPACHRCKAAKGQELKQMAHTHTHTLCPNTPSGTLDVLYHTAGKRFTPSHTHTHTQTDVVF